jgi:putative heme iron utilization protein
MTGNTPQTTEDFLAAARQLVRGRDKAALATLARPDIPESGAPYASLVQVAFDHDGAPLLLISGLADHTKNLLKDARVSLLFDATQGRAEPLTGPRVSLMGVAAPTTEERHARRYLARFPAAEMYAGFKDFAFWRVAPGRAHQVAGFGKIQWFENFAIAASPALIDAEPDIVAHMNADHADAVQLYAALAGESGDGWVMTGVDPEGADIRRPETGTAARVAFDKRVHDAETARAELVRLVKRARAGIS